MIEHLIILANGVAIGLGYAVLCLLVAWAAKTLVASRP